MGRIRREDAIIKRGPSVTLKFWDEAKDKTKSKVANTQVFCWLKHMYWSVLSVADRSC